MSRAGGEADRAHLDALLRRMLAGLLLLGAGLLLGLMLLLALLPQAETPAGTLVILPGSRGRHGISTAALPVLGAGALLLGLPGLLALGLGPRLRLGRMLPRGAAVPSFRRPALVLLSGVALLAVAVLRR